MLTCLTHEDAVRLLRQVTQKGFFKRLALELARLGGDWVVDELHQQWSAISGDHHRLSRERSPEDVFSDWAVWSDRQSMHPLLMASWSWWRPLLQGAVTAQQLPSSQILTITEANTDSIWVVLAAVYARGVDEVYLVGEAVQQAWRPLLDSLPVVLQCVDSTECPATPLSLQPILPAHWYRLFGLLCRLCQDLNAGHRVNFEQEKRNADQYLNRLLLY